MPPIFLLLHACHQGAKCWTKHAVQNISLASRPTLVGSSTLQMPAGCSVLSAQCLPRKALRMPSTHNGRLSMRACRPLSASKSTQCKAACMPTKHCA
eukprot:scaffold195547_cov27-Tisochrysis_lutea.AAC.1